MAAQRPDNQALPLFYFTGYKTEQTQYSDAA